MKICEKLSFCDSMPRYFNFMGKKGQRKSKTNLVISYHIDIIKVQGQR